MGGVGTLVLYLRIRMPHSIAWGNNGEEQLTPTYAGNRVISELSPLSSSNTVSSFSTGGMHSCGIISPPIHRKNLACWGDNDSGQLGLGDNIDKDVSNSNTFPNLGTNKTASAVSAGNEHTCAILNDEKVKCWGKGGSGRLGNGASTDQNSPVAVSMSSNTAKKISAGGEHTCAIFDDDKVYCWGENAVGELGIGSTTDQNTPTVVDLGTDKTATAIGTGFAHTCALLNDKSVKCWGGNHRGQLGNRGHANSNTPVAVPLGSGRTATAIHAKGSHTCAILDDGSLLCWGENVFGQLGDGTTTSRNTPVAVDLGEGRTAMKVGGGASHTCAILDDESLKCWGYNNHGQTALPTAHRGDQPGEMGENLVFVDLDIDKEEEEVGPGITLELGTNHACAIDDEGRLTCWGLNDTGQLGVSTTDNDVCPLGGTNYNCIRVPVEIDLGDGRKAVAVGAGNRNTCAILDNGSLLCWGEGASGALGTGRDFRGSDTPVRVALESDRTAEAISFGSQHSCAILDNGAAKCWGYNGEGQLGDGNVGTSANSPVSVILGEGKRAVAIASKHTHVCAILNDKSLVCWGGNVFGQLGNNDNTNHDTPVDITLPESKTATVVIAGFQHTCAILNDDSLACWGRNEEGELGVGTSGNEVCSIAGTNYDCIKTPAVVDLGSGRTAKAVNIGDRHTCAVLDDGSVKCWGLNNYGQLGDGTTTNHNTPVAVTLPAGRSAVDIHAGYSYTCAVLDDNSVMCWGHNSYGQLLDGTTIDRYKPVRARL